MTANRVATFIAIPCLFVSAEKMGAQGSVRLNGATQCVAMGRGSGSSVDTALDSGVFTLERWFNWGGGGSTASTDGAGIPSLIALIPKGAGEAESSSVDVNYIVGQARGEFKTSPGAPIKERSLQAPDDGFGNITSHTICLELSFARIAGCVDAFRGAPYPVQTLAVCP